MVYSEAFRRRIVSLMHVYDLDLKFLADVFGPKKRTVLWWYSLFVKDGVVDNGKHRKHTFRWPHDVLDQVSTYCWEHPIFYLEEFKEFLENTFQELPNVSLPTICCALNFDLQLTRKILTKAAHEAAPEEIHLYHSKVKAIYHYPAQLVFIDETSKDGRHAYQRYARSKRDTKAVVKLPFSRGKRVSVIAALNVDGFMA